MSLIVQKYGGSSLADAGRIMNVARRIIDAKSNGDQVVVTVSAMGDNTDALIDLANKVSSRPSSRELDLLLSTGELVSCALVTMALKDQGCDAIALSGAQAGIRTNSAFGKAQILSIDTQRLWQELESDRIVVIAGFQGITEDMDITTLGRGASDTTAVALAVGLHAKKCEIYTDVAGIFTADPRAVPGAVRLPEISYEEMLELANYGAKMNPRSIELAAAYEVPILVASSFVDSLGTLIHGGPFMEARNKVTGIATDSNVAKITVLGIPDRPGIAAHLFEPLADANISVDTIVQNASVERMTDLTFTVDRNDLKQALEVVIPVAGAINARNCVSDEELGKVSIVGTGMQNAPGYASKMFRTLSDAEINIEMIATSEIRITCIISENQLKLAAKVLHTAFGLDEIT